MLTPASISSGQIGCGTDNTWPFRFSGEVLRHRSPAETADRQMRPQLPSRRLSGRAIRGQDISDAAAQLSKRWSVVKAPRGSHARMALRINCLLASAVSNRAMREFEHDARSSGKYSASRSCYRARNIRRREHHCAFAAPLNTNERRRRRLTAVRSILRRR